MELKKSVLGKSNESVSLGGVLRYQGRLCFPNINGLRTGFLRNGSRNSIHPSSTMMYMTLEKWFGGKG